VAGKKSTIAYDDAHCHLTAHLVLLFIAQLCLCLWLKLFVDVIRPRPVTGGVERWQSYGSET
jgi:hypothetical protein